MVSNTGGEAKARGGTRTSKSTSQAWLSATGSKKSARQPPPVVVGHAPKTKVRGVGRPTDYKPEFVAIARAMAKLGGTDFEIAEELGVKTSTIWRWRSKYPEFCSAIEEGKEAWDNRIERSLAQRAAGYSYHSEKVFNYEGQIVRAETIEHVPPDVGAIRLWLMNRRPDQWRDKQELKMDSSDAFLKLWRAISDGTASAV